MLKEPLLWLAVLSGVALFWRLDVMKRDLNAIKEKLGLRAPDKGDY